MPCPVCGGVDRIHLGGDDFRCRSQRLVNAVPPGLGGNAGSAPIPIYETCDHRYTLAEETAYVQRAVAQASAEAARTEAQQAEARRHWDGVQAVLYAWFAAIADPTERELQLARIGKRDTAIDGLGTWFVGRVRAADITPWTVDRYRKTFLGSTKTYHEPGWLFLHGSTHFYHRIRGNIALTAEGQWLSAADGEPLPERDPPIHYKVLHDMASILKLGDPPGAIVLPDPEPPWAIDAALRGSDSPAVLRLR